MIGNKKRLCFFAGFDSRGEIADYVIYYIKALSKIADVYYWGEFEASESEKSKIKPYCKEIYCAKHGKYDFGSWQELLSKVGREKVEKYDELILANDSCYGPLFNLGDLFTEMDSRDCDVWGLSMAHLQHIHIQSYFMVLKKPVLQDDTFYDFMKSVKSEKNHKMVCACYEQRFTYILNKAGFNFDALVPYGDRAHHPYYDIEAAIQKYNFPLLKVKFFSGEIRDQIPVENWHKMITGVSEYSVKMIEDDLVRRGFELSEVDTILRENHDPDLAQTQKADHISLIRRIVKKIINRVGHIFDGYIYTKLCPYDLRDDILARNYRNLKHDFDLLAAKVSSDAYPLKTYAIHSHKKQSTACYRFALRDYTENYLSPLPLPLTHEADILLIGNMSEHNLSIIGFDEYYPVYLNNLWIEDSHSNWFETNDLSKFYFYNQKKLPVKFDLILVQPFAGKINDDHIKEFIANVKKQMLYESVLVMLVRTVEADHYRDILSSEGLISALSVHGLVVGNDPFEVYCDKIRSIKGYQALIYKIK